jgi:hypothetical protein
MRASLGARPSPARPASAPAGSGVAGAAYIPHSAALPEPVSLNMMRLVNANEGGGGSGADGARPTSADHDFLVEVSPESLAFLRSFGELGLNVVSVFGGAAARLVEVAAGGGRQGARGC